MQRLLLDQFVIPQHTRRQVLEKIKKYTLSPRGFYHVVSLNPENIVVAQGNRTFKRIIKTAHMSIIDGIGIVRAAQILHITAGERYPGVDLMNDLIRLAGNMRLPVLLIGGRINLADNLAKCYSHSYPKAKFMGIRGVKNIKKPSVAEESAIRTIVTTMRPRMIFVAFGSPYQEIWLNKHKDWLKGCLCMGVGGGFDYLSGLIQRPPFIVRRLGGEWLFRLIRQPWRLFRQIRLIIFVWLVIKQLAHDTIYPKRTQKTRS